MDLSQLGGSLLYLGRMLDWIALRYHYLNVISLYFMIVLKEVSKYIALLGLYSVWFFHILSGSLLYLGRILDWIAVKYHYLNVMSLYRELKLQEVSKYEAVLGLFSVWFFPNRFVTA